MLCCTLPYVHSSIAIILMGKRELIALLNLSSWCLMMVERLFLAVPRGCLQFEEIFTLIWNLRAFYNLQIEHYALKIAFWVQCYSVLYFPTANYSVYGVN